MSAPILYINMGGEMLYVLQQRLQIQKISFDKTIQVMNDVIYALLNPKQLARIFEMRPGPRSGGQTTAATSVLIGQLRPILERVVLSSIMKLDANSMGKLFDLMIMMVKYQLSTASGPRELILSTLNHLDAIRDMAALERSLGEHVDASHRLVIDTYGQMTHKQVWQIRNECLHEIQDHNVRVSILLRLGMQNQDATFNRLQQRYNERYLDREQLLEDAKLVDYVDEDGTMGVLGLFGDRATLLGKNVYNQLQQQRSRSSPNSWQSLNQVLARSDKAMRQEFETLARQLGKEDNAPIRPFSLHLFQQHENDDKQPDKALDGNPQNQNPLQQLHRPRSNTANVNTISDNGQQSLDQYKSNLIENVNSQFADKGDTRRAVDTMDFTNLLHIV